MSDREREWPLLQAMWDIDTVEIPRPRWFDPTGEFMGTKTIVMDHVAGTPLQLTLGTDGDVAAARTTFLEVAAALVRTPLDGLPAELERPPDWDSYIDSAIDIYAHAEADLVDSSPLIRYVSAWLRANRPPPVPLGLVHGDFQPGNVLVAEGRPPVVIDWEFTRIGDPARTSATTAGARSPTASTPPTPMRSSPSTASSPATRRSRSTPT